MSSPVHGQEEQRPSSLPQPLTPPPVYSHALRSLASSAPARPPSPPPRPGEQHLATGTPAVNLRSIAPARLDRATESLFKDLGKALGKTGTATTPVVRQKIAAILAKPTNQPEIRARLTAALKPLLIARTPEAVGLLRSLITDRDPAISLAACQLLGEFMDQGYPIAFEVLQNAQFDHLLTPAIITGPLGGSLVKSLTIAYAAGNEGALTHLRRLVNREEPSIIFMTITGIDRAIEDGYPLPVDIFDKVNLAVLFDRCRAGDPEALKALWRAGEGGNIGALESISSLARDPNTREIKEKAITMLGNVAQNGNLAAINILRGLAQENILRRNYPIARLILNELNEATSQGSQAALEAMAQQDIAAIEPRGLDNIPLRSCVSLLASAGNPAAIQMLKDRLMDTTTDHSSEAIEIIDALATARERGVPEATIALEALAPTSPSAQTALSRQPNPWQKRTGRALLPRNFETIVRRRYAKYLHNSIFGGASSWGFRLRSATGEVLFCRVPRIAQQRPGQQLAHGTQGRDFQHKIAPDSIQKERQISAVVSDSGFFPQQVVAGDMEINLQGLTGNLPYGVFETFDQEVDSYLYEPNTNLADIQRIAHQSITALQYMVRIGLVHHDLHSRNLGVRVDSDGHVIQTYICDVGEAGSCRGTNRGAIPLDQLPPAARPRTPREEAAEAALLQIHTQHNAAGVQGASEVIPHEARYNKETNPHEHSGYFSPAYDAYGLGMVLSHARTALGKKSGAQIPPETPAVWDPDLPPDPDPDPELTRIIKGLTNPDPAQRLEFLLSYRHS